MSKTNNVAETDSEKRPYISTQLGDLSLEVCGAEGEGVEAVCEEFDARIDEIVEHAKDLQDTGPTNGTH